MILMQTGAIFLDAYRELNAKKLFWITMVLSALVVLVCAMLGINKQGITFLWFELPFPVNSDMISPKLFYLTVFTSFGLGLWLTWIATILALVSTAGMFPDLIASGSIETVLSKPMSRTRLFLTKYLTGLVFMGMQLVVFCSGFFLLLGIRGETWQPGLFLAVPIVLAFFSFLFSVQVLLGLVTKSTIASLLLTLLFWLGLFGLNAADAILVSVRAASEIRLEDAQESLDNQIAIAERTVDRMRGKGEPIPGEADEPLPEGAANTLEAVNERIPRRAESLQEAQDAIPKRRVWSDRIFIAKTLLPKTGETIALLERNLISDEELDALMGDTTDTPEQFLGTMNDPRAQRRAQDIIRKRSITWVLGTSLAFEAIVLGICLMLFARRDF